MSNTQIAFLAGFLTGRGAFGVQDGRHFMFIKALDEEIAEAAMHEWGGHVTLRPSENGFSTVYKWQASHEDARRAIEDMTPHLVGVKRERAEALLGAVAA
jgi:hypothetical protein